MDGISIKPPAKNLAARDPVTVREAVATDLGRAKPVAAAGDGDARSQDRRQDQRHDQRRGDHPAHDHGPTDLLANPESRDLIYRERDVRAVDHVHTDQALLAQRAYRPAPITP